MVFDPYDWSKNKISNLVSKIIPIKNDGSLVAPGQIWSIKKLLVLDYYIQGFVTIVRKYFNEWYYVDTHCGAGLIGFEEPDLRNERFPGSPLIATLRAQDYSFTDYFLSDSDSNAVSALTQRLQVLKTSVGNRNYSPITRDFASTVNFLESKKRRGKAFLIFIDPTGFKEITWNLMEQILSIETADVFFTFMTPFIALNRSSADNDESYAKSLDEFFGDSNWVKFSTSEELLQYYIDKIKTKKNYIFQIPIYQTGQRKLYDIIIATNSKGAGNIVSDANKIMEATSTELITNALKVVASKSSDLTKWFT